MTNEQYAGSRPQEFQPSEATLKAWEVRSHLLSFRDSEPGSIQAELAQAAARTVFDELTALTMPQLTSSVLRRTNGDYVGAEDIVQETYARAWKFLPKFRGDSQVETWLHSIMFTRLSNYYSKAAKQRWEPLDEFAERGLGGTGPSFLGPEQSALQSDLRHKIAEAVGQLSHRQRYIVIGKYFLGRTHAELAQALGITEANTKMILNRAKKRLGQSEALRALADSESSDE